jgi:hypothetical protein
LRELRPESQNGDDKSDSQSDEDKSDLAYSRDNSHFEITRLPDGFVEIDRAKRSWGGYYTLNVERVKVTDERDEGWVYVVLNVEHQFCEKDDDLLGDETNERLGVFGRSRSRAVCQGISERERT